MGVRVPPPVQTSSCEKRDFTQKFYYIYDVKIAAMTQLISTIFVSYFNLFKGDTLEEKQFNWFFNMVFYSNLYTIIF